jgi:hypothetical protein
MIVEQLTDLLDDILQEKNEKKLWRDTRRKHLRCASDIIIRCSKLDVRCWTFVFETNSARSHSRIAGACAAYHSV